MSVFHCSTLATEAKGLFSLHKEEERKCFTRDTESVMGVQRGSNGLRAEGLGRVSCEGSNF